MVTQKTIFKANALLNLFQLLIYFTTLLLHYMPAEVDVESCYTAGNLQETHGIV